MSVFCNFVSLFFQLPQAVFDFVFGLVGATAPDLTFGIGSIFGCNL